MKSKSACARLPAITSADLLKAAPAAAVALIVAEGLSAPRHSIRRIALDWLTGSRNDAVVLRSAAGRFAETAMLADASQTTESADIDGSCCLKTSPRKDTRWTVRSIPLALVKCWAGFEDALGASAHQSANLPAPEPAAEKRCATAPYRLATKTKPGVEKQAQTPVFSKSQAANLPAFAPLSALILDRKKGFEGNCASPDGKYISDGKTLFLRSACDAEFLSKLIPLQVSGYGPEHPLPESRSASIMNSALRDATLEASIAGYILGGQADLSGHDDEPFVCVHHHDTIVVVNGHRLRLIERVTGAKTFRIAAGSDPHRQLVVCCKDGTAVAVLMAIGGSSLVETFSRMLCSRPASVAFEANKSSQRLAS